MIHPRGKAGEVETEKRNSFQQNIIELYRSLLIYKKLKHSLSPPTPAERPEVIQQMDVGDLIYDSNKDNSLSDKFFRFRELTANLSKNPSLIKLEEDCKGGLFCGSLQSGKFMD